MDTAIVETTLLTVADATPGIVEDGGVGIDGVVPPMAHYAELGGTVELGTDQAPGPGHHDVFRERRTAALLSKIRSRDPTAMPSWGTLRLATVGGARALGIDDRVGTLEEGKQADVVTVDHVDADRLRAPPRNGRDRETGVGFLSPGSATPRILSPPPHARTCRRRAG